MTILYKPVQIETAEQAEALPLGTVAFAHTPLRGDCYTKYDFDNWEGARRGLGSPDASMVGWTALVPIEAEEEWAITADVMDRSAPLPTESAARAAAEDWKGGTAECRLVTPWEEA